MNPWNLLEAFEEKYGNHERLLNNLMDLKALSNEPWYKEDKKMRKRLSGAERLLTEHNKLIWCVMGYMEGIKYEKKRCGKKSNGKKERRRKMWIKEWMNGRD